MSKHHNEHASGHQHDHATHPGGLHSPGLHKDWRAWVVVLVMLAGIATYVLTLDESDEPGDADPGLQVPAAAE